MPTPVDRNLVEQWLRAWCLSRRLPVPVPFGSGFKVEVGYADQKTRYVFPEFNAEVIDLAATITEPYVFLKICNAPVDLSALLPAPWAIQPEAAMMTCFHSMKGKHPVLPVGYTLEVEQYPATYVLQVMRRDTRELAASGRVIIVDDLAVYDRICTTAGHRRRGLANYLMHELEKIALAQGIRKNFLVATEEGRLLYQSLGWEIYCAYSSVVIAS